MRMTSNGGRALMDTLIEVAVLLLIVPPLVCCALEVAGMVLGVLLPWLMLLIIGVGVAACLSAGVVTRRRVVPPLEDGDLPVRVPPVRRPAGIRDRRQERRDR